MNINDALFTDIAHVGDLLITPGGDIDTISGLRNLKNALFHRLMTVPGTLVHRPSYGVGVPLYLNNLSSFATQQRLATLIQEQFKLDPRVEDVSSVSISEDDTNPQITIIRVFIKPIGYSEQEMSFTPFAGGI